METIIRFALSNFMLTFAILGLIAAAIALTRAPKPLTAPVVVEALLAYFMLFSVGFDFLYNFVMHTFFGEIAAAFIGWADSPFQVEVGCASLGIALIGLLGFRRGFDMRLAAVLSMACFQWGAAALHIREIVNEGNFAPGNAGIVLYADILLPLAGFILLWLQHRYGRPGRRLAGR